MSEKNASKLNDMFIWNSIGGLLDAGQSVVILMVITRTAGIVAAGIFSIAYATGNLFLNIGKYGVRNYQISDLEEKYSFYDYLRHRLLTIFLMLIISIAYCLYGFFAGGYSLEKAEVVFLVCVMKALDSFEEVFEGRLQQRGRLDLSGKMMTVRILVVVGGIITTLWITDNLLMSVIVASALEVFIIAVLISFYWPIINLNRITNSGKAIFELTKSCFPVCIANLLSFYLTNAPKYAIDRNLNETAQAKYNFIAMPVFVIQLMNTFMYQPVLVKMTISWNDKKYERFMRYYYKILMALCIISAVVLAGSWFFGIPVLSLLYATDLTDLKTEFMIIMVSSIFLALTGYFNSILTIIREQNRIPVVYIIGAVISLIFTNQFVRIKGIYGAVIAYLIIMFYLSIILSIIFHKCVKRHKITDSTHI